MLIGNFHFSILLVEYYLNTLQREHIPLLLLMGQKYSLKDDGIIQSELKCLGIATEKRHFKYRKMLFFFKLSLNDLFWPKAKATNTASTHTETNIFLIKIKTQSKRNFTLFTLEFVSFSIFFKFSFLSVFCKAADSSSTSSSPSPLFLSAF